jgi:hypothetical protein
MGAPMVTAESTHGAVQIGLNPDKHSLVEPGTHVPGVNRCSTHGRYAAGRFCTVGHLPCPNPTANLVGGLVEEEFRQLWRKLECRGSTAP